MATFEYINGEYCDDMLVYSSYDCGYNYSILLYTHGVQYIAKKGKLYIDDKLVLEDICSLNKFLTEYASCFACVVVCEDGNAVLYQCHKRKGYKIKIEGINDIAMGKFE